MTAKIALFLMVIATTALCQTSCSAQWQCQGVSTDYNFVGCINNVCKCRSDLGFSGAATSASKCGCPSPNSVIWQGSSPYCLNLQNAVTQANKKVREGILKEKVKAIYQNLVGVTPQIIAASGQALNDLFDINAVGRVTPIGTFHGLVFQQYFYALAANYYVARVSFVNLKADGNTVSSRVDVNFQPLSQFPVPDFNLTQTGVFHFNEKNVVSRADLSISNLGAIQDIPPPLQPQLIQGLCATIVGNPLDPADTGKCNGENQQFTDFNSCVGFMSSIPFGSFYRANSNTVTCRLVHIIMVAIPPKNVGADIHCPHVGPTGGGKCVDFTYDSFYEDDIINPAGFP